MIRKGGKKKKGRKEKGENDDDESEEEEDGQGVSCFEESHMLTRYRLVLCYVFSLNLINKLRIYIIVDWNVLKQIWFGENQLQEDEAKFAAQQKAKLEEEKNKIKNDESIIAEERKKMLEKIDEKEKEMKKVWVHSERPVVTTTEVCISSSYIFRVIYGYVFFSLS